MSFKNLKMRICPPSSKTFHMRMDQVDVQTRSLHSKLDQLEELIRNSSNAIKDESRNEYCFQGCIEEVNGQLIEETKPSVKEKKDTMIRIHNTFQNGLLISYCMERIREALKILQRS